MTCREEVRLSGAQYWPRSCPTCKFGPCPNGYDYGRPKPPAKFEVSTMTEWKPIPGGAPTLIGSITHEGRVEMEQPDGNIDVFTMRTTSKVTSEKWRMLMEAFMTSERALRFPTN